MNAPPIDYPAPPMYSDPIAAAGTSAAVKRSGRSWVGWAVWAAVLGGVGYLVWRSTREDAGTAKEAKDLELEIERLRRAMLGGEVGGGMGHRDVPAVVVVTPPPILGAFGPGPGSGGRWGP